jgi:hypothetical protein
MGTTPLAGLPYPEALDDADVPADIQAALLAVEKQLMLAFADATARDSAITVPVAGMLVYLTTPDQVTLYDGTGWVILSEPPQTWSNPFTGITGGSPSFTGWYKRGDGLCTFRGRLTLGGTPSAFAPALALPIAGETNAIGRNTFLIGLNAAGGNTPGLIDGAGTILAMNASSTYVGATALSTTIPGTWASGNWIDVFGTYRMASRYS